MQNQSVTCFGHAFLLETFHNIPNCRHFVWGGVGETTIKVCTCMEQESGVCAICYDVCDDNTTTHTLGCSHRFHTTCIVEWFRRSHKCPLCNDEGGDDRYMPRGQRVESMRELGYIARRKSCPAFVTRKLRQIRALKTKLADMKRKHRAFDKENATLLKAKRTNRRALWRTTSAIRRAETNLVVAVKLQPIILRA